MGPVLCARVDSIEEGSDAQGALIVGDHTMRIDNNKYGIRSVDEALHKINGTGGDEEAASSNDAQAEVVVHIRRLLQEPVWLTRAAPTLETSTRTVPYYLPAEPPVEAGGVELQPVQDQASVPAAQPQTSPLFGLTIKSPEGFEKVGRFACPAPP